MALGSRYARHIPGSGWLPRRLQFVPVGKLGPGTYYIPYGRKGYYVNLRIVAIHHGKGVRAVQMGDGFPGNDFELDWDRSSHFGVPTASMVTGRENPGCWIDVGLRGRLFIKASKGGGPLTRLNGKWVKWGGAGPNHLIYKGVKYAYDRSAGRWERVVKKTAVNVGVNPTAVARWRRAATEGDPSAMERLGSAYLKGKGLNRNYSKAMAWFQKAAAKGNAKAMVGIASLYGEGLGVARNFGRAMEWLRRAAAKGDAGAEYDIGLPYNRGDGVARDYRRALKWWHMSASKGSSAAMAAIGSLYALGHGEPRNYVKAMEWFRRAAAKGNAVAMVSIGGLYAEGHGVEKSYTKAVIWFRKGAKSGSGWGAFLLGSLYYHGQGVAQNDGDAIKWLQRALRSGDRGAVAAARDELEKISTRRD